MFSEILSEFLKKHKDNDYYIAINLSNYNLINENETLVRNNINNNDKIILYSKSEKGNNLKKEDNSEILYNLLNIYQANLFSNSQKKRELNEALIKNKKIPPKLDMKINPQNMIIFLKNIADNIHPGIKILEHEHKLVCCLTNDNWVCEQCKNLYKSQDEKFYCSLCDYNLCQQCRKNKNYDRRKAINKKFHPDHNIDEESELLDEKKHKLKYCLTSRNYFGDTSWDCNLCNSENNKGWGFYCTFCDYDVCTKCFYKKYRKD